MPNINEKLIQQLRDARRVSTPLVAIRTPDSASTIQTIYKVLNGDREATPILRWDCVRGLVALTKAGKAAMDAAKIAGPMILDPAVLLDKAVALPEDSLLVILNANRFFDASLRSPEATAAMQALWNLRDQFKQNGRMVVLTAVDIMLPPEVAHDIVVFDEPYPRAAELEEVVRSQYANTDPPTPMPDQKTLDRAVEALLGLPSYPAEDAIARNLRKGGVLDIDGVWERKIATVNSGKGQRIHYDAKSTFAQMAGNANAVKFLKDLVDGKLRPRLLLVLDEMEKQGVAASPGAANSSDPNGMTQLGMTLSWMDGINVAKKHGLLLAGVQGCGKTMLARLVAAYAGIPLLLWNLSEMRGEFMGNTERDTRIAMRVADALSDERIIVIGTSNRTDVLPPELQSRFTLGTFFVDLPDLAERHQAWDIYMKEHGLPKQELPDDADWSGREVAACAFKSWAFDKPLVEVAKTVNPVARAMGARLTALRQYAQDAGFISASYEGPYVMREGAATVAAAPGPRTRKLAAGE